MESFLWRLWTHKSLLKTLKHVNTLIWLWSLFVGEYLFPSIGKSWKTLSHSQPKSTKSYTNKYLVFKGLRLHEGEVPPSVSSSMDIARRVWKYAHQVLGLEGWSPSAIQWFKKGRTWGTVISSLLSFCAFCNETFCLGSLGPSPAQHRVPMCIGGSWFLILLRPTSPSLHLPLGGLAAPLYRWEGETVVTEYTELLLSSQEAWVQVLVLCDLGRVNHGVAGESMGFGVRHTQPFHFLAVWSWARHFTFLHLSFLTCQMGIIIIPTSLSPCYEKEIK